jgi:hypothetical protein
VRTSGRVSLIGVDRVHYLQGAGSYSELVLRDGSTALPVGRTRVDAVRDRLV